jgi:hypothetical protein
LLLALNGISQTDVDITNLGGGEMNEPRQAR